MIKSLAANEVHRMEEIGLAFASEAKYPGGFSLDQFMGVWVPTVAANRGDIIVNEDESGRITAALGAAYVPDGFSGQPVALEQFWYVLPEFRKTRAGLNVFFAFENTARFRQVKRIVMVHLAALAPEKMQAFYESQGYRMVEQTFWKEL